MSGFSLFGDDLADIFSFLTLIKEYYIPMLPPGVTLKGFISKQLYRCGESRWFGFNQTTAPVVFQFDSDDYMHPQTFQVLGSLFERRPELDFALMVLRTVDNGLSISATCSTNLSYDI